MATQFTLPRQVKINVAGRPYAGAQAFFYQVGTETPQTVYQDSALTTPHTQPILSDDDGYWPVIWLDENAAFDYRSVIQSSTGVVLEDSTVPRRQFTQQSVGAALYPRTSREQAAGVTPESYTTPQGHSERYGESDSDAFGGNFTAMTALKPFGGSPASYGGLVVNAPYGRFNIGSNWVTSGLRRQMYQTGYATMIQGDENGDIGLYTYGTSIAQGQDWQPKYSFILRANGTQLLGSNGTNQGWHQTIMTGANTPDAGGGTDRLKWGCVATAGEIISSSLVGDVCWANLSSPNRAFLWSADGGSTFTLAVGASNYYINGAAGATSVVWEYRINAVTKGYIGFSGSSTGVIADSVNGDAVIRSNAGFRVSTNDGVSSSLVVTNAGSVHVPNIGTTASAANAFIDNAATNSILRSTSSLRYKTDVEPMDDATANRVLSMVPIRFRSLCAADNPEWTYYGLAAEEVAQIDPRYVFLDPDGKPDGVQYDRFVPALIVISSRHERTIAALEARVAELEAKLA